MFDLSPVSVGLLMLTGLVAGVINTLAGGGSNLTIPALMVIGLPADVANATNRVGVMLQSFAGVAGFRRHGKLDGNDLGPILLPSLVGGLVGAGLAAVLPVSLLKPLLLGSLLAMALLILWRPDTISPPLGTTPLRVNQARSARLTLFIAGVYGGFVQAGVGFILLAALSGVLRYDIVRANALKMLITGAFTAVALVVFIAAGLVSWLPGLLLGLSSMLGANLGVRLAIRASPRALKWFLFLMTLCACGAAMFS